MTGVQTCALPISINSDGYSSVDEAVMKIVINPPFWFTIWAYMLYVILIILILLLGRYIILRGERNRSKMEQIREIAKKNEELNDLKLRFFTNISHELRTPLTLILSPVEMLLKDYASDDILTDKLKMVQNNALRLMNLVNQLLDFRKGDVKGHKLVASDGNIIEFVSNICDSFTTLSEKKNVHLTFFSSVKFMTMSFDQDKIGKVMMNLLSNAFKFTHSGGRVDVSIDIIRNEKDEMIEIKVSDNGIGINDEDKEHIFDRFYQVNHESSTGSGVGLSIVRDFVTLHDGSVKVIDNAPCGSVFIVLLPVKQNTVHTEDFISESNKDTLLVSSETDCVLEGAKDGNEDKQSKESLLTVTEEMLDKKKNDINTGDEKRSDRKSVV